AGGDASFDLYNQAFALLAYACGHGSLDPAGGWRAAARTLRRTLSDRFAHPRGGFREDTDGRLVLRSNPHMHRLEAALVWAAIDDDPAWRIMADEIAELSLRYFIDPATGAVREFFSAADWSPLPDERGQVVEPGHLYEWAYLLQRWARLTGKQ